MSNVIEFCEGEFARYVEGLYKGEPDHYGLIHADVPWYREGTYFTQEKIPQLVRRIRATLDAKRRHSRQGPAWAQPLPTALEDCLDLTDEGGRRELLGHFGCSVWFSDFDLAHPPFFSYSCSLLAHADAPKHLRTDTRLLEEFPPRPLVRLGVGLLWHPTPGA
jgi:hypothetical protein